MRILVGYCSRWFQSFMHETSNMETIYHSFQVHGRSQEKIFRGNRYVLLDPDDNNFCMLHDLLWWSVVENPGYHTINRCRNKRQCCSPSQKPEQQPDRADYELFCPGFLKSVVCLHCLLYVVLPAGAPRVATWRQCVFLQYGWALQLLGLHVWSAAAPHSQLATRKFGEHKYQCNEQHLIAVMRYCKGR